MVGLEEGENQIRKCLAVTANGVYGGPDTAGGTIKADAQKQQRRCTTKRNKTPAITKQTPVRNNPLRQGLSACNKSNIVESLSGFAVKWKHFKNG